jgi:anti-sigma28 factor (negative regulator of flagellin synthesis)
MKILNSLLTGSSAAETGRTQQTQDTKRAGSSTSTSKSADGSSDHVEFSGGLSQLSRALASFQANRGDRVNALTADYQSGKYQVSSLATSQGIVTEALSAGLQ